MTSTGSGLSVPDWPLSFGRFFPPMVGGVFYEHGHRMIAAGVAMLTFVLCVWLLAKEPRAWVRNFGLAAFGVVCLQAFLGGLTVLLRLPPAVTIAHAGLAEIFFSLIVSIAIVTSANWEHPLGVRLEGEDTRALPVLSIAATIAVYVQILLGALVRHTHASIVFHLLGALATLFFVGRLAYFVNAGYGEYPALRRPAMSAAHLVGLQLFLGLATWVAKVKCAGAPEPTAGKIWLSTFHLAAGALLLATMVLLTWRIFKIVGESQSVSERDPSAKETQARA